jgi:prevent-host-death family protein
MASLSKSLPGAVKSSALRISTGSSRSTSKRAIPRGPIAAAKAKAHFLQLLDQVERDRLPITITKRGRVVAQLTPAVEEPKESALDSMIGRLKGTMTITGDIVSPDHEFWGPDWR